MNYSLDSAIGSTDQENSFGSLARLALITRDKIASVVSADKAKIDTLTMVGSNLFQPVQFIHDSANATDEFKTGGTDQWFDHTVNFSLKGHDQATIVAGRQIALGQDYVALAQRMSGQWFVYGLNVETSNGMNCTVYTANAVAEANARVFTLNGKCHYSAMLIDAAAAQALIDTI